MKHLANFNAFGLVTVRAHKVTATVTAVINDKPINRSVVRDVDSLPAIADGGAGAMSFAAWLESGKKVKVVTRNIGDVEIASLRPVTKVLSEALELVKESAEIK